MQDTSDFYEEQSGIALNKLFVTRVTMMINGTLFINLIAVYLAQGSESLNK